MSTTLRVLMVAAANATSGGGEKHVADLLRGLNDRDVELGLVAPPGGDLSTVAESLGVTTFPANIEAGFSAGRVAAVRRAIDGFAPDIVHAHGSRAAMFARLADSQARKRVVYTVHGIHVDRAGGMLRKNALLVVERYFRSRTARFITVCAADLERGARLGVLDRNRASVVYNGIALPQPAGSPRAFRMELGVSDETPLVLCVGRFEPQKDHATLIEALGYVRQSHTDAVLALVGSGSLEGQIKAQVASLGLGDAIKFAAPRARIADAYTDADVVALSSRWEGLPYTVIEAMAYGKPVVATCVDGIPEAVEGDVTGLLVKPGDVTALASALGELLADPDRAARMGREGAKQVAERFSMDRMLDELASVYEEVAG